MQEEVIQENNKSNKKIIINILVGILAFGLLALMIISIAKIDRRQMKLVSVEDNTTYVSVYVQAINMGSEQVYASDFAINVDNVPIKATYIGSSGATFYNIADNQDNIQIFFEIKMSKISQPITVYYSGQSMTIGNTINV